MISGFTRLPFCYQAPGGNAKGAETLSAQRKLMFFFLLRACFKNDLSRYNGFSFPVGVFLRR